MSALLFAALRRFADGRFHSGEAVAKALGRTRASLSEALKRAPEMGIEVFSVPGKGYRLAMPIEFLDRSAVMQAAGPAGARVELEIVDEIDSTSTRLLALALEGAASGTCLAAEWQRAGRGRRGRTWVAPLGGSLAFSLLRRFDRGAGHLAGLSLAAGIAVARALRSLGVAAAQVKWPNDVVIDGRKLAGILVETSGEMQGPSVAVIGIGVNVRLDDAVAASIDQPVTDAASHAPQVPSRNALLGRMLAELVYVLDAFERAGFAALRDEWRSLHAYHRQRVRIFPPHEAPYEAEILDVANDGTLLVNVDGRAVKLASAEIAGADDAASVRRLAS